MFRPPFFAPLFLSMSMLYVTALGGRFERLIDVELGRDAAGLSEVKQYLNRFGYFPGNFTDTFDARFAAAVSSYQTNLGLPVTGRLDSSTVSSLSAPRCGVVDSPPSQAARGVQRYLFFPGQPRWAKATLSYAFSPGNTVDYLTPGELRGAFRRAFDRWAAAIPVTFRESPVYGEADIKIGFFGGDHGDGEPFDGVLGVLAHAFSPENGRLHLDAAETWAVDFKRVKSKVAVDLESVATHEIGHVLGLAHSPVKEAVMYPSLSPRSRKVDLTVDDVEGAQFLYGSNPDFNLSSLAESDTSKAGVYRILPVINISVVILVIVIICI